MRKQTEAPAAIAPTANNADTPSTHVINANTSRHPLAAPMRSTP
jgi:hypothetical protein